MDRQSWGCSGTLDQHAAGDHVQGNCQKQIAATEATAAAAASRPGASVHRNRRNLIIGYDGDEREGWSTSSRTIARRRQRNRTGAR